MAGSDAIVSLPRRIAATACGLGAAAGLSFLFGWDGPRSLIATFMGAVGLATIGLSRSSVLAQIVGRAAAWVLLVPSAVGLAIMLSFHRELWWVMALIAGGAGASLVLARPMLHTREARAEFAPIAYRRTLLAGSTASIAVAAATALGALDVRGAPLLAASFAAVSASLAASGLGVLRMRAWGMLLGIATSILSAGAAAIASTPTATDAAIALLLFGTTPGLFFALPIVASRLRPTMAGVSNAETLRVRANVAEDAPARVRVAAIATPGSPWLDEEEEPAKVLTYARSAMRSRPR
jgi:hypothetical protein